MTAPSPPPLENLLRQIAAAAPEPWYPAEYARAAGVPRDSLDAPLDRLRLAGLVRLTDWVKDLGQGYAVTPEGFDVLRSPRALAQLGNGHLPPPRAPAADAFPEAPPGATAWERSEAIREALLQPLDPVVTKALIAANVGVFLLGLVLALNNGLGAHAYIGGSTGGENGLIYQDVLLSEGALRGQEILRGQWWRLLTCCFVHIGLLHLGVNMYTLYVIGPMMERMWGRVRYLVIYLVAGLGGSCAMVLSDPRVLGAGASGALWGVIASQAIWIFLNRKFLPPPLTSAWLRSLLTVFLLNVFISMLPGISAAAHFGGGAVGAVVGALVHYQRFGTAWGRRLALLGLVLAPVACLAPVVRWTQEWTVYSKDCDGRVARASQRAQEQFNDLVAPALFGPDGKQVLKPSRRDPEQVRRALAAAANQRGELRGTLASLEQCGPFYTPHLRRIEQREEVILQAFVTLFDLSEQALKGGDGWEAEGAAVDAQVKEINRLQEAR